MGRIFSILLALLFVGCSTSLGHRTELAQAPLQAGETHKSEVAEILGFPWRMQSDPDTGYEFWAYKEKPALSGVYYAVPTGASTATAYTVTISQPVPEFSDAALICTFNREGVLESLQWGEKRK